MNPSALLDGRPWAVPALLGASVLLNVVLATVLLWPSSATSAADPTEAAAADAVADAAVLDGAAAPGEGAEAALAEPATPALPPDVRVLRASVDRNLGYTLQTAGAEDPDKLAAVTARLFVWDLDLRRDLQRGDTLAVAYGSDGEFPVVHAARYGSKKLGHELTAYRFQASGDAFPSYWAADGTEVPHVLVDCPLRGNYEQITSLLKDRPSHKGMDFKTPVGTEVVTPRAATVVRTNWNFTYNGNAVEVRFADGTLARFLHLSETSVQPGQSLAAGAVVGLSGNTGRSTAPHLHYELEKGGKTVDPAQVHGTRRRSLSDADRARFDAERARFEAALAAEGV
jgi:murein DD-endopeptidase